MRGGVIFPELVVREDEASRPWTIHEGSTMRGAASCNLTDRILEVPLGPGASARVVRAHELMHARVSPLPHHLVRALDEVSPRALECAEELRVNTLLGRLHFDLSTLRDGTEKAGAQRLASEGAWGEAACFMLAVLGTGAEREFFGGIRRVNPSWLAPMRAVRKRVLSILDQSTQSLGLTRLNDEGLPSGYATSTLPIARLLTSLLDARVPASSHELRAFRRSLELGGRRPRTGVFAPLVIDGSLERRTGAHAMTRRTTRSSSSGTVLRYPSRLLTDDHRRGFVRRVATGGGVVVVDQSGSMDLDVEGLHVLVRAAPHALVLGYSHRPGDLGATPNCWVLCDRRWIAASYPSGNVGNGVDGPALRWALAQRRRREPVVWITDGQVTDSHDHPDEALAQECATLVRRHRIRLARDLPEAKRALRTDAPLPATRLAEFGRVGRKLLENRGF
ncbi:MAG: hypothetical protein WCA31_00435 [Acidimicrobiales bacterium]